MKSNTIRRKELFCPFTLCIPSLALQLHVIRQGHVLEMLFLSKSCCIIHTPLLYLEKSQTISKRNSKRAYNRLSQALPSLSMIPFMSSALPQLPSLKLRDYSPLVPVLLTLCHLTASTASPLFSPCHSSRLIQLHPKSSSWLFLLQKVSQ